MTSSSQRFLKTPGKEVVLDDGDENPDNDSDVVSVSEDAELALTTINADMSQWFTFLGCPRSHVVVQIVVQYLLHFLDIVIPFAVVAMV